MRASISRATIEDAESILHCLRAAFAPYRARYTAAAYDDTVMTLGGVRRRIETMTLLVARGEDGRVLGTIGAITHGEEGHIRGMAVLPEAQGSGIADSLLAAMERELLAAGCCRATLGTTPPLARAIRFYERNGYVRLTTVADFFGMPLFEYRKDLRSRGREGK